MRCFFVLMCGLCVLVGLGSSAHGQSQASRYQSPFRDVFRGPSRFAPSKLRTATRHPRPQHIVPASYEADAKQEATPTAEADNKANPEKPQQPHELLTARIAAERTRVVDDKSLDEDGRAQVLRRLDAASELLRIADEERQKEARFRKEAADARQTLDSTLAQLREPIPSFAADVHRLSELESRRAQTTQESQQAHHELNEFLKLHERRTQRKAEIIRALSKLTEANTSDKEPDEGEAVPLPEQLENSARTILKDVQTKSLQAEQAWFDALSDWFPKQRELLERTVSHLDRDVERWQKLVTEARSAEARRQEEEARSQAAAAHPSLKAIADRNTELAKRRTALGPGIEKARAEADRVQAIQREVRLKYDDIRKRVEAGGLTTATGLLLREYHFDLPRRAKYHARISSIERELPQVQLKRIDAEAERIRDVSAATDGVDQSRLGAMAKQFADTRNQLVQDLSDDLDSYQAELARTESSARLLVTDLDLFTDYIGENILWIKSHKPLQPNDFLAAPGDAMRVVPALDAETGVLWLTEAVRESPLPVAALALVIMLLVGIRGRSAAALKTRGELAARTTCTSMRPTFDAVLLTAVLSLSWPLLIAAVAMFVKKNVAGASPSVCNAIVYCAGTVALLETARQIFRTGGLGTAHFGWTLQGTGAVRKYLLVLGTACIPLIYLVVRLEQTPDPRHIDSGSRVLFAVGMGLLGWFLYLVAWPSREPLRGWLAARSQSWMARLRYCWSVILVGVPLGFAAMSAAGYHYTATHLAIRIESSLGIMLGLFLLHCLTDRALLLARRRTMMATWKERDEVLDEEEAEQLQQESHENTEAHSQLERLLGGVFAVAVVGVLWVVWADVTPAFGVLNRVELWSSTTEVWESVQPGGPEIPKTVRAPITLKHLLLSILIAAGTILSSRNIPGFLRVVAFRYVDFDAGARHAITTICRYVLTLVGFVLAFRMIGIGWANVQWMAAAMTVGLGFGMQEIFANFVSGLIILFERPVRVGDVVTVGGVTGKITGMRIRATTVTDRDNRELIVPNKKFITEDVMNWTLTDSTTRLIIAVGVSYDTDTALVGQLLEQIARDHELVLQDPEPVAAFVGFGDSTLDFELRLFIPKRDFNVQVRTDINTAIITAFRQAKIEISFPQRDLHIRTMSAQAQLPASLPSPTDLDRAA
jgi:potassium efflux system protein